MNRKIRRSKQMAGIALFGAALGISGAVNANLVQNGDFMDVVQPNYYFYLAGVANWSAVEPHVVIYAPNGANTGSTAPFHLWGPANGICCNNGLTSTSPNGNNYVAADADPDLLHTEITQNIQVIPGNAYELRFDYAAAQYTDRTGNTNTAWQVSLDGTVLTGPNSSTLNNGTTTTTPVLSIGSQGFSGWKTETLDFIAPGSGTSPVLELLSFLAVSTDVGLPPVGLLDSVSIDPVPEPESLMLLGVGVAGLAGAALIRRRRCSALGAVPGIARPCKSRHWRPRRFCTCGSRLSQLRRSDAQKTGDLQ